MKREELIKKWLDHNLNDQEQQAFEALEDHKELVRLSKSMANFKPSPYKVQQEYATLLSKRQTKSKTIGFKPLMRVAAVVVLALSFYFYTTSLDTKVVTEIAQQTSILLPDESSVNLNAGSRLVFNKKRWSKKREVLLEGEAFFKVAKGSVFDVLTSTGRVTVLGTQFNVTQRDGYFKVICFEGLVGVTYNDQTQRLHPGESFMIIDGKLIATGKENNEEPNWINGESAFKSTPLKYVLSEFERQYGVIIKLVNVNEELLFSGSFTHKNLDLALKSITLPLHLSYNKKEDIIIITGE